MKFFRKHLRTVSPLTLILFVLFIIAVAACAWSFVHYRNAKMQLVNLQNGQALSERQLAKVTRSVQRHMIVPEGKPSVMIVKDPTALAQQAFFRNVRAGDVVLVYKEQAVIYSPDRDVIVNVGPVINPDAQQNSTTQSREDSLTAKDVTVEVRNGSSVAGRASTIGDEIENLAGFTVATTTNAKDRAYTGTIIVNQKGKDVSVLETKFGVRAVTALPAGEPASSADVVVILGN